MEILNISEFDISLRKKEELKIENIVEGENWNFGSKRFTEQWPLKTRNNLYKNIKGCEYFFDKRFTPDLANLVFKFRTRMYEFKNNFRKKYENTDLFCPVCLDPNEVDTQQHLYFCRALNNSPNVDTHENCFQKTKMTFLKQQKKLKY